MTKYLDQISSYLGKFYITKLTIRTLAIASCLMWVYIAFFGTAFLKGMAHPEFLYGAVVGPIIVNNIIGEGTTIILDKKGLDALYFLGGFLFHVLNFYLVCMNLFTFSSEENNASAYSMKPRHSSMMDNSLQE